MKVRLKKSKQRDLSSAGFEPPAKVARTEAAAGKPAPGAPLAAAGPHPANGAPPAAPPASSNPSSADGPRAEASPAAGAQAGEEQPGNALPARTRSPNGNGLSPPASGKAAAGQPTPGVAQAPPTPNGAKAAAANPAAQSTPSAPNGGKSGKPAAANPAAQPAPNGAKSGKPAAANPAAQPTAPAPNGAAKSGKAAAANPAAQPTAPAPNGGKSSKAGRGKTAPPPAEDPVPEVQPELEPSIRQRAVTLLTDAAAKGGAGGGPPAAAAGAALEAALHALFFGPAPADITAATPFVELRDRYRKKLTLLCLSVARAQELSAVVASLGGPDDFAAKVVKNDKLLLPAAAKQQRDEVRRRGIEEAFQSVGGTNNIGVCPRCKKQILPEWGDCYTHWGAACEKDNCCTCSPYERAEASEDGSSVATPTDGGTDRPKKVPTPTSAFPVFAPGSLF
ncbi:hypothetical protein DIPPA_28770 [Diplonema papillatum]|nr:hypothetical protein DIPPA_28770 [Diplonema papillatum]KAJ9448323.1 hypothetical protein DIPPA_28770 [Diplonema papillatum]